MVTSINGGMWGADGSRRFWGREDATRERAAEDGVASNWNARAHTRIKRAPATRESLSEARARKINMETRKMGLLLYPRALLWAMPRLLPWHTRSLTKTSRLEIIASHKHDTDRGWADYFTPYATHTSLTTSLDAFHSNATETNLKYELNITPMHLTQESKASLHESLHSRKAHLFIVQTLNKHRKTK